MKYSHRLPDFFTQSPLALAPQDKVLWLKGWMFSNTAPVFETTEGDIKRAMLVVERPAATHDGNTHFREALAIIDKAIRTAYAFRSFRIDRGKQLLIQLVAVVHCISHRRVVDAFEGRTGLMFTTHPTHQTVN